MKSLTAHQHYCRKTSSENLTLPSRSCLDGVFLRQASSLQCTSLQNLKPWVSSHLPRLMSLTTMPQESKSGVHMEQSDSGRTFLCKHTTAVHLGALSHPCHRYCGQGHLQSPPLPAEPASHVQLVRGEDSKARPRPGSIDPIIKALTTASHLVKGIAHAIEHLLQLCQPLAETHLHPAA